MGEVQIAALLCAFLFGGETETRQYFDVNGMKRYVRVDCETPSHVIEIGLDGTASARDSLHQALFFSDLTGKRPMVILIDQDGYEGRFEYEMRRVTAMTGVAYATCSKDLIVRWAATAGLRGAVPTTGADDLPANAAATLCDLRELVDEDALG